MLNERTDFQDWTDQIMAILTRRAINQPTPDLLGEAIIRPAEELEIAAV